MNWVVCRQSGRTNASASNEGVRQATQPPITMANPRCIGKRRTVCHHDGMEKVLTELECRFCGHTWWPRTVSPKKCPRCQRYGYEGE